MLQWGPSKVGLTASCSFQLLFASWCFNLHPKQLPLSHLTTTAIMAMQPCYNHHHIYTYIVTTTNATYVQPSAHTHTYGDVYTHTHICTHRNTCIHINTLTRADLWTHMRTYTCPRTQTLPTHTCTPSLPMATYMYATNTQVLTTQKHTQQVSTNIHNMQGWSHTHIAASDSYTGLQWQSNGVLFTDGPFFHHRTVPLMSVGKVLPNHSCGYSEMFHSTQKVKRSI